MSLRIPPRLVHSEVNIAIRKLNRTTVNANGNSGRVHLRSQDSDNLAVDTYAPPRVINFSLALRLAMPGRSQYLLQSLFSHVLL